MTTDAQVYTGAALAGAISGMRSMSSPALISQLARSGVLPVGSHLGFLAKSGTSTTTAILAVGEIIADKLPSIPSRTAAGPLAVRALTGGFAGATISSGKKRSWQIGALLGVAGAIGATYAAYHLRKQASEELHLPDTAVALVEDLLVVGTGLLITSMLRSGEAE